MEDDTAGVPEWVVTYGDMMSLLLTFFIMLVSLSEIVANQKYQAIMQWLQEYVGYRTAPRAPLGEKFPLNSVVKRLDTLGSFTKNKNARGGVKQLAPPGSDLRIFSISNGNATLVGESIPFDSGNAAITSNGRQQLQAAAVEIAGKPNKIVVVGHVAPGILPADAVTRNKTLLSYLRAKAVANELTRRNIDIERIRILAAGDTRPLTEGDKRRGVRADRVEIYSVNQFVEHFRGDGTNGRR